MKSEIRLNEYYKKAMSLRDPMTSNVTFTSLDENQNPVSRILTIRNIEGDRISFVINDKSPKAGQLQRNKKHEILIYWPSINVQYRIRGKIVFHKNKEMKEQWIKKSKTSKIMDNYHLKMRAQTSEVESYEKLKQEVELIKNSGIDEMNPPSEITMMVVEMEYVEQWIGSSSDRIHERSLFTKSDGQWSKKTLVP